MPAEPPQGYRELPGGGPFVLLDKPRPARPVDVAPAAGANYAAEAVCPSCGPCAAYVGKDGKRHCGRCHAEVEVPP